MTRRAENKTIYKCERPIKINNNGTNFEGEEYFSKLRGLLIMTLRAAQQVNARSKETINKLLGLILIIIFTMLL
jgi:hypothetical protein